jgi:hypothetical protein
MNRRNLILTLALAAMLPSSRLPGSPEPCGPGHPTCDKRFADMITTLEHTSWEIGQRFDAKAARAFYARDFFEVLMDGSVASKQDLIAALETKTYVINFFEISEVQVVRISDTAALIRYHIFTDYVWNGEPGVADLRVTSSYALINGQWKNCSYQETAIL